MRQMSYSFTYIIDMSIIMQHLTLRVLHLKSRLPVLFCIDNQCSCSVTEKLAYLKLANFTIPKDTTMGHKEMVLQIKEL